MGRASVSYTNKDYESLRRELLDRVPQLTDRWTDFNASDLGVVLLELFCGVGDMLAYYLDAQAAEAFLPTARQRQSVINLCKLINYRLDTPVAATTSLRFSLSVALDADLIIPTGTACRALLDDGQADFETVEDAIIPCGSLATQVGARQGIRKTETFSGTGEPWQKVILSGKSVAQGSLRVRVDGEDWNEIHHFQDSGADSPHFRPETDYLDATTNSFGDGKHGAIPANGAAIEVSWLETLGAEGNLAANLVTHLLDSIYLDGQRVQLSVTNPVPATGGADRETLDHARRQAPAELRALWKAVTKADYKALAEGHPGVAKAEVLDTNDCTNIRYYNVHLAIAPSGGGQPSPLLKQELAQHLEERKVITVEVNLFDPIYRAIQIDAEVFAWPGEDLDLVRSRIESGLADFFAFDQVSFGQSVHFSDIVALLDGTRGVSHVRMYAPQDDIILKRGEIPVLGEVHLDMRRAG
ncbi:putative baseplate assembly protein [bacterium]|nr:putative baseplate assembly protein [bacterium]